MFYIKKHNPLFTNKFMYKAVCKKIITNLNIFKTRRHMTEH